MQEGRKEGKKEERTERMKEGKEGFQKMPPEIGRGL
jgi:hypothetical protein